MTDDSHTITVIIPAFARPEQLGACLKALAAQEGGPYRTYVIDDGSPDPLAHVCAPYPWVSCLRQANAGPAAARNAGAAAALASGARFLCFTDDDCRPHPNWVRALVAAQGGDPSRLVGGRVENALRNNPYAEASQSLNDYLHAYFLARDGKADFFTTNNMGCAAESFEDISGFDESFPLAAAEDRDFGRRWRDRNGPLVYATNAVVDHAHSLTLSRFWRQHANYGRGACHLHETMETRGDRRNRFEALQFYAGLVFHPLRRPRRGALRQTALMGLSQMAMVAGYVSERRSAR